MSEIDEVTRGVLDRVEIQQLVSTYSMLVDQRRMTEFVDLFVDDCFVDFKSTRSGPLESKQALAEFMEGLSFSATSHHNNFVLTHFPDSDSARGVTALYAWHETPDGRQLELWGRYEDEFVRTPQGWRFKRRELVTTASRWTAQENA